MAELADAPDLGSGGKPCRFKSCYPHFLYCKVGATEQCRGECLQSPCRGEALRARRRNYVNKI